jgi:hypothetical protein
MPAVAAWVATLVVPTVRMVNLSFLNVRLFISGATYAGMDNYQRALDLHIFSRLINGATLAVVPLLVFFVAGPGLGWAAAHAGPRLRRMLRVAIVIPLACFIPVVAAAGWYLRNGYGPLKDLFDRKMNWTVEYGAVTVGTFGITCALALTVYLAVFRNAGKRAWPAALVVSGLAVLTALALGTQEFGSGLLSRVVLTEMMIPSTNLGLSAAIATVEFVTLATLGLLAMALLIPTGTQLSLVPRGEGARPSRWSGRIVSLVGVGLLLGLAVLFLAPWASRLGQTTVIRTADSSRLLADTWLPPAVTTAVAIAVALLGGFGIGALRPLGRYSELLLIPFAPWLFTGTAILYAPAMWGMRDDLLSDPFARHLPPAWMSVPALVLFTLFFRGQVARRVTAPTSFARAYVWPSLGITVLAGAVLWIVQAHDLLWQRITFLRPTTLSKFMENLLPGLAPRMWQEAPFGLVTPPWLAVAVVVAAALAQWFLLDRIEITAGSRFPDRVVVGEEHTLRLEGQNPFGWVGTVPVVVPGQHHGPIGAAHDQ